MSRKNVRSYLPLLILSLSLIAAVPAFAGSLVVGSVAQSMNSTIGGQPALEGSTVFSGDVLKVTKDGATIMTYGRGSRAIFGRNSEVSFLRNGDSVTAHVASGSVSVFQPTEERSGIRLAFGDVTVGPAGGYKTLGEVAMLGDSVVVRTKEGMMSVNFADGKSTQVPAGKVLRLVPDTKRAPQGAMGSQHFGSQVNPIDWAILAAAGTAAILAGVDISKANDATTAANSAGAAANAATSAANSAASDATAAASAASAAAAAASAAAANANTVGCALDKFANANGQPSPYTPPSGSSCS